MDDARVTVFTTGWCGYCNAAKQLLKREGVPFKEIDLTADPVALAALKARTGHRTVPQIFVDDRLIGGYTELAALVRREGSTGLRPRVALDG